MCFFQESERSKVMYLCVFRKVNGQRSCICVFFQESERSKVMYLCVSKASTNKFCICRQRTYVDKGPWICSICRNHFPVHDLSLDW